jgi:uncharacterized protein (DUF58 family)
MKFSSLVRLLTSVLRAANHDFCPNLNVYVYWLKQPIGWVVAATFFSLLIGLFVGPQGFVLAFAFFALLILGLVWPWLSMKGIRCGLTIPGGPLKENEAGELVLSVRNYWPIPVFGLIIEGDFLQGFDADEEPIAFSLKRVPALSKTEFPVEVTPRRRGTLPAGEVLVRNGFPFGLADVSKPVLDIEQTLVWPQCSRLQGSPPAEGNLLNLAGALADRSGNDGETIGIRCYREGDRIRNIHWAQTVRSQKLMVRERQTLSSTVSTVLLDLSPEHHCGTGIDSSFEWAIRIAASICLQLHRTNSSFRVVCVGLPKKELNWNENTRGIESVMNFLAGLPTLKMQQEVEPDGIMTVCKNWVRSSQTFFVCTTSSAMESFAASNIEPIVIQLDGFAEHELTLGLEASSSRPKHTVPARSGSFLVTSPRLASSQLELAWLGRFGHAAG